MAGVRALTRAEINAKDSRRGVTVRKRTACPVSRPGWLIPSQENVRARAFRTLVSSPRDIAASFAGVCGNPSIKVVDVPVDVAAACYLRHDRRYLSQGTVIMARTAGLVILLLGTAGARAAHPLPTRV